jgi:hypothetical protein
MGIGQEYQRDLLLELSKAINGTSLLRLVDGSIIDLVFEDKEFKADWTASFI